VVFLLVPFSQEKSPKAKGSRGADSAESDVPEATPLEFFGWNMSWKPDKMDDFAWASPAAVWVFFPVESPPGKLIGLSGVNWRLTTRLFFPVCLWDADASSDWLNILDVQVKKYRTNKKVIWKCLVIDLKFRSQLDWLQVNWIELPPEKSTKWSTYLGGFFRWAVVRYR